MQEKIHIEQVRPGVNKITVHWPKAKQDLWLAPIRVGTIRRERCQPYCLHPKTGLVETDLSHLYGAMPQQSDVKEVFSSIYKNKPPLAWLPITRAGLEGDGLAIGQLDRIQPTTYAHQSDFYFIGSQGGQAVAQRGRPHPTSGGAQIESGGRPEAGDWWVAGVPVAWEGRALDDPDYMSLAEQGLLTDLTDWLLLPRLAQFGFLGVDQIAAKGKFPWQFTPEFKQALLNQKPLILSAKVDGESIRKGEELFSQLNRALRRDFAKQKHQGEVTEHGHVYVRRLDEIHLLLGGRPRPRLLLGLDQQGALMSLGFSGMETEGASRGISLREAGQAAIQGGMHYAIQIAAGPGIRFGLGDMHIELGGDQPEAVPAVLYWK